MLALSDAAINGFFGVVIALIALVGTIVTLLNRSTKAEARQANAGVDQLSRRVGVVEERDRSCRRALRSMYGRMVALEENAGLPVSAPPDALSDPDDDDDT